MNRYGWIRACFISALLLVPGTAFGGTTRVEGTARTFPAGEQAYTETHEYVGTTHRVAYRDPSGRIIAEKTLDYGCDDNAPEWRQQDLRNGRKLGGHWAGEEYVLQRDDRSTRIRPDAPFVASSGFDHFVRQQWSRLERGDTVEFDFALPARLSSIGMRIHQTPAPLYQPGVVEWFLVEPSSGFFRMFGGTILLGYDENRDLAFYRGPSNIGDGKGGSLMVEIRYARLPEAVDLAKTREPTDAGDRNAEQARCIRRDA